MTAEDAERFKMEILPKLAKVPLSQMMRAVGVSKRYASMIRRGLAMPHPMHHNQFRRLVDALPEKASVRRPQNR